MLKFNKNSWHHKMYCFFHQKNMNSEYYTPPSDFCSYVRNILLILCFYALIAAVASAFAFAMVVTVLYFTDSLFGLFPNSWDYKDSPYGEVVGLGLVLWAFAIGIPAGLRLREWVDDRKYAKYAKQQAAYEYDEEGFRIYKPEPVPEPGLFTEWYRAFKGKFCPTMTFS